MLSRVLLSINVAAAYMCRASRVHGRTLKVKLIEIAVRVGSLLEIWRCRIS